MPVDTEGVPQPRAGGVPVLRDALWLAHVRRTSVRSAESTYSAQESATDPSRMTGPTTYAAVPILGDTSGAVVTTGR